MRHGKEVGKKRAGALALCGGILIAGTSVVGAQENP